MSTFVFAALAAGVALGLLLIVLVLYLIFGGAFVSGPVVP